MSVKMQQHTVEQYNMKKHAEVSRFENRLIHLFLTAIAVAWRNAQRRQSITNAANRAKEGPQLIQFDYECFLQCVLCRGSEQTILLVRSFKPRSCSPTFSAKNAERMGRP